MCIEIYLSDEVVQFSTLLMFSHHIRPYIPFLQASLHHQVICCNYIISDIRVRRFQYGALICYANYCFQVYEAYL